MKSILIKLFSVILLAGLISSCAKDPGMGGNGTIKGKVTYADGPAAGATVSIKYGTTQKSETFDFVTVTDSEGNYKFEGLTKGDYFLMAQFTNSQGFKFNSAGCAVKLGSNSGEALLEIEVQ
jgi:hypothetical protein